MNRTDQITNTYLARVVDRFLFHSGQMRSKNPIVAEAAWKMSEVEIWEMWVLTQEGVVA